MYSEWKSVHGFATAIAIGMHHNKAAKKKEKKIKH